MKIESSDADIVSWMHDWSPSTMAKAKGLQNVKLDPFLRRQQVKLLHLRQRVIESINGVGKHARETNCETSVLQTHQADVASEVNDRDFALGLLSHEHDALHEIDQALQRIESGAYGICEMSGQQIPRERLEAIPFARFTVECQSQVEKGNKVSWRSRHLTVSRFDFAFADMDDEEGKILTKPGED
jgi:RNA polymerase-binding protein DksA